MPRTELFLGNLGRDITRSDIEKCFDKYGRLIRCDLKNRGFGANFAFLEFEDERDAEDAMRAEHGKDLYGSSMVVEWAKSKDRRDRDRDRNGRDRARGVDCYDCGERGHFARDCRSRRGSGRNRVDRNRDRSRDRRRSRSRDRSRDRSRNRSRDRRRSRSRDRRSSRSHSKRSSFSRSPSRGKHSRHSRRESRDSSRSPVDKRSRTRSPKRDSRSPKRRATKSPASRSPSPKHIRADSASPVRGNGHAGSASPKRERDSRSPSYGKDRTNGYSNGHSNGSVKMDHSDHE